jgi:hypothetical protein
MSNIFYCSKCKRKTPSTNVEHVKTANNKWRLKGWCDVCKGEKSTFTKAPSSIIDVRSEEAREVHRPVIKKFPKRKIVTLYIDDLWAADLVIMDKFAKENDGYKYMLNVIDTFSKFAWSEPLFRKNGDEVVRAFNTILQRATNHDGHKAPNLLHTDKGREFVNKEFRGLLNKYDIKMYHTENEEKSAIIERFNRTLNERMKVQFEARRSFRWVDILQSLLSDYNASVHTTIHMRPVDVNANCESQIRNMYLEQSRSVKRQEPKLNVGDRVRIVAKKNTFANKYARNWTREIFTISYVQPTAPVTYRIKDVNGEEILGSFYEKELLKSNF